MQFFGGGKQGWALIMSSDRPVTFIDLTEGNSGEDEEGVEMSEPPSRQKKRKDESGGFKDHGAVLLPEHKKARDLFSKEEDDDEKETIIRQDPVGSSGLEREQDQERRSARAVAETRPLSGMLVGGMCPTSNQPHFRQLCPIKAFLDPTEGSDGHSYCCQWTGL